MLKATLFFALFSSFFYAQDSNRYTDSLFNFNQVVTDGIYATAPEVNKPYQGESFTHDEELKFHLFSPENDSIKLRPLLICIHGGGFVSGNKEHDDMIEFCKLFAKKGYVTTTIQYRLGLSFASSVSSTRAVYRGVQDGRAAVRYFKENASIYGIDTNYIYLLGSSAGAFISLHNLFMNEEYERPLESYQIANTIPISNNGPDLGTLDAINPTLKHGSHPKGVISLWGAIQNTDLIKATDGNIPLLLIHGTVDGTVPFDVGHPFGLPTLPETYGSKPINEQLISLGFNNDTYFVPNEDHEFYGVSNGMWSPAPNAYWDTVVTKATNFLWGIHKPEANFNFANANSYFEFFDSSMGAIKWEWNFGDNTISNEKNPSHTYAEPGSYLVTLKILNLLESWDTTSTYVIASTTGIDDNNDLPTKYELSQNYPNPFNPSTVIQYSIPNNAVISNRASSEREKSSGDSSPQKTGIQNDNVTLKIYNILGQEVATLVNKKQPSGRYEVMFDASRLASGIYIYRLVSGQFVSSKKLLLLK